MTKIFESGSFRELLLVLLNQKALRKTGLRYFEAQARKVLEKNQKIHGILPKISEAQIENLMRLLYSIERAYDRGIVSKYVLEKIINVFLQNVLFRTSHEQGDKPARPIPPLFLTISPTAACNLNCPVCYADSSPRAKTGLSYSTVQWVLDRKKVEWGSFFTVISGGEPLVWRSEGKDIFGLASENADQFFIMFTNGVLINKDRAKKLARIGNVTPAISVEGFEEKTDARRGHGSYRKILKAMENLRTEGVPFGISVTATCENSSEIVSDEFVEKFFFEEGAVYGWLFQYMPIGRRNTLDLMITPEQRFSLLERVDRLRRHKGVFYIDFWNDGPFSEGCISAGREGGYLYIDSCGNITPCVFVPYAVANVHDLIAEGKSLSSVLDTDFFVRIRGWQKSYGYKNANKERCNWVAPCIIRDHYKVLRREIIPASVVKPINKNASEALEDDAYREGLEDYGARFYELSKEFWREKFLGTGS